MSHILVINSSASGQSSVSRLLVSDAVARLRETLPGATVTYRDVGETLVPHLTHATVAGVRAVAETAAELATRDLSDALIEEVRAADVLVIGAPMYNFSIPSTLRTWFDHVLRPRVTFAYSAAGPEGLMTGKRAIVLEARGGLYSEGPSKSIDFQEPYLRQLLGFIGISDVAFIRAEKIGYGPEARELALASARGQIDQVVARLARGSAWAGEAASPAADADAIGTPTDFDALMQANLLRVFGEHDPDRRIVAIRALYHEDAQLHEPGNSVQGHEAILHAVSALLAHLPRDFSFRSIRPALGHNGVARLQWSAGPHNGPLAVTGTDVATIDKGRIRSLHVFLDQE